MDEPAPINVRLAAEVFGTFALVFAGTGAIVVDALTGGTVTHVGISLTFFLVVAAMVFAIGDVSGAHINPAVTIAFWLAGRFPAREVLPYAGAQFVGAIAASAAIRGLFGNVAGLGSTVPAGSVGQSFALEVLLTFLLMYTILHVATGARERGIIAGFAIGAAVGVGALFGGPISGASMNPARSLGPALMSGALADAWLYVAAPVLGAALSIPAFRLSGGREKLTGSS